MYYYSTRLGTWRWDCTCFVLFLLGMRTTLIIVDRRPHAPPGTDFSDLGSWRLQVAARPCLRSMPFGAAYMSVRVDQFHFLLQRRINSTAIQLFPCVYPHYYWRGFALDSNASAVLRADYP